MSPPMVQTGNSYARCVWTCHQVVSFTAANCDHAVSPCTLYQPPNPLFTSGSTVPTVLGIRYLADGLANARVVWDKIQFNCSVVVWGRLQLVSSSVLCSTGPQLRARLSREGNPCIFKRSSYRPLTSPPMAEVLLVGLKIANGSLSQNCLWFSPQAGQSPSKNLVANSCLPLHDSGESGRG